MSAFAEDIYVSWKPADSQKRYLIGKIRRVSEEVTFKYDRAQVYEAMRHGMNLYTEFQDISKEYRHSITSIFAQRLTPKSRFKTSGVYKFWEISQDMLNDDLTTIAFTQALLPTDSFEFLADFIPYKGLSFITDLVMPDYLLLPANLLDMAEDLVWRRVDTGLEGGIKVEYEGQFIGLIKQVHSNVFYKYDGQIRVNLYDVEKSFAYNESKSRRVINKIFVKVQLC